jgi:hypothetical protein
MQQQQQQQLRASAAAHPPDAWVQVTPPAAHALLVCAAIAVARNLCPAAHAKGLHQFNQLGILLLCPLVTPDVGVDLQQQQQHWQQQQ